MGVLEDVVMNAKSAATTVGKHAERLVDISKLRVNAAELNGEIAKKYEALGRLVYDSVKADARPEGLVDEYVEAIDVLCKKLDEVNEKINILRNKTACPICGEQNAEGAIFCSHCGVKLKYNDAAAEPDAAPETAQSEEQVQ
jgi:hypothetical protein